MKYGLYYNSKGFRDYPEKHMEHPFGQGRIDHNQIVIYIEKTEVFYR